MASIAKSFYNDLQQADLRPQDERARAMEEVLEYIEVSLPPDEVEALDKSISQTEIDTTLRQLPCGKAAGLDGLPYEFWKWLATLPPSDNNDAPRNAAAESFCLSECLAQVFNDIQHHGVDPTTGFSEGWICPLYKKKDRREITNYRPITLLNSDYKLFTKILAIRLARAAPLIIHENQAGFLPGRSITDQIRLTQMILHYAEATEENGAIIALDQEKAYDKVMHDYLWRVLDKFGLPLSFRNTVKSLYESAETIVIVNGEASSSFRVTRGVRQEMLRRSPLSGFKSPNTLHRSIVSMFADDTTVYLSATDDVNVLNNILSKWCCASGAKFNIDKTEIIPIGTLSYRLSLAESAKLNPTSTAFPPTVRIARDGQAVRILGAWLGNKVNEPSVWSPILEKLESRLRKWNTRNPSIEGRRTIIQWTFGSMTQYLTCVQGMPRSTEDFLTKRLKRFAWDSNGKSNINFDVLCTPVTIGGKGILNLRLRNEAIEMVWLKKLLSSNPPAWVAFAHELLRVAAAPSPTSKPNARTNYFLQSWPITTSKLPPPLNRCIILAKKYNLKLDALYFHPDVLGAMPVWFHTGALPRLKKLNNYFYAQCIRDHHKVTKVREAWALAQTPFSATHSRTGSCTCENCVSLRNTAGCLKPFKCVETASDITKCIPYKWLPLPIPPRTNPDLSGEELARNRALLEEKGVLTFDPALIETGPIENAFRILCPPQLRMESPAAQQISPDAITHPMIEVSYGSHTMINEDGERISSGSAFFAHNDPRNTTICIADDHTSCDTGSLSIILETIRKIDHFVPPKTKIKIGTTVLTPTSRLGTQVPQAQDNPPHLVWLN